MRTMLIRHLARTGLLAMAATAVLGGAALASPGPPNPPPAPPAQPSPGTDLHADPGDKRTAPQQDRAHYPKVKPAKPQGTPVDEPTKVVVSYHGQEEVIYQPAPGYTPEQTVERLHSSGADPNAEVITDAQVHHKAYSTGAAKASASWFNDCAFEFARTYKCPPLWWANTQFADPQLRFIDHSSSQWPINMTTAQWNQADGIDANYLWNNCPFVPGSPCIDVWSGNYGNSGFISRAYLLMWPQNDGTYRMDEGGRKIELNDYYPADYNLKRRAACNAQGYMMGIGNLGPAHFSWDPPGVTHPVPNDYSCMGPGQVYDVSFDDLQMLTSVYSIWRG